MKYELSERAIAARRDYQRRWREKNREHVRAYMREWKQINAEHLKEYNVQYFERLADRYEAESDLR